MLTIQLHDVQHRRLEFLPFPLHSHCIVDGLRWMQSSQLGFLTFTHSAYLHPTMSAQTHANGPVGHASAPSKAAQSGGKAFSSAAKKDPALLRQSTGHLYMMALTNCFVITHQLSDLSLALPFA